MKIFSEFVTVNTSNLNFWLVICIAKNLIWTTLKMIFSIFRSDSRFSNSCISVKYCPIITNHTSMERLFIHKNWHDWSRVTYDALFHFLPLSLTFSFFYRGVHQLEFRGSFGRNGIPGPVVQINLIPDPNKPVELSIKYDSAATFHAGDIFPGVCGCI